MDNEAYSGGGGIFVSICGPNAQITNNLIINNSAVPNINGNPPGINGVASGCKIMQLVEVNPIIVGLIL